MKWFGALLRESNVRWYSFNNMEIASLRGQFTVTIKYNGHQAKAILLILDMVKVATCGTDTIEALQLVINRAT
uniref:Uncharacterized protein n=1 Tax=Romanomermis culicivorax TaxID=13658 RepID=A0A915HIP9_ROMCU